MSRARPGTLAALLVAVALSACLDPTGPLPSPPESMPSEGTAIVEANNATDCNRVFPAIFVDRAHAQTFLPEGFTAAESSRFFGQDSVPANRAVLVISMMECQGGSSGPGRYEEAMAGVFIDPPPGASDGEHFYELGRVYTEEGLGSTLNDLDWARLGGNVETSYSAAPTKSGAGRVLDEAGVVFEASVPSAALEDSFSGTFHIRWWHETPHGLGVFEYTFTPDGFLGPGSCHARAGSMPARVIQSMTCPDGALLMIGPPFDVEGRFHHEG